MLNQDLIKINVFFGAETGSVGAAKNVITVSKTVLNRLFFAIRITDLRSYFNFKRNNRETIFKFKIEFEGFSREFFVFNYKHTV